MHRTLLDRNCRSFHFPHLSIVTMLMLWVTVIAGALTPACWGQVTNEEIKLLPDDGGAFDHFGQSIALDDRIVVVGASGDDDVAGNAGAAYLFEALWGAEILKLLPSDGMEGAEFGYSVAIENGMVAVGARWDEQNGTKSGSAYLFDVATGEQIRKILPSGVSGGDWFGCALALNNGIVAVGASHSDEFGISSGSAYVFDALTGEQLAKLLPDDGARLALFGTSIDIDNGIVVVGAPGRGDIGSGPGYAYLFDAATGAQIAKLSASDGADHDLFGFAVAIDDDVVAIGAFSDNDNGRTSGSAYLFDASSGAEIAKLLPNDGEQDEFFGWSIDIDSGRVAVGARWDNNNGHQSGSAYLFDASTGNQIAKLLASDGGSWDLFGWSLAIDGDEVAVGALHDRDNGEEAGSAYVFDAESCLELTVENLVAGEEAVFTVRGGTPGVRGVTLYGFERGRSVVYEIRGYCGIFGIKDVLQGNKPLRGAQRVFDANGEMTFEVKVPWFYRGDNVFFQSAQRDTCPERCTSQLVEMVVE